jgi:hypothetical protein
MVNNTIDLRSTLDKLARTTWVDIEGGRWLGVGMGEVSITDHNMLALRREYPSLVIHKHSSHEEVRTGADWEWWLRISDKWICLVFQAKMLNINGRYSGITKGRADGKPQVELLLRHCLMRSERLNGAVWPLYCFYNSWQGGWPQGVPRFDGAYRYAPSREEIQLYGCAAASAWMVRHVLIDASYSNRRTVRDSYLPISRPWSMIFPDPAESTACSPRQIMNTLSSWIPGQGQLSPAPPLDDTADTESGRTRRRSRLDVYRDPMPINQPPEYILDLLQEGRVQPRRLKPLARRIVILPEIGVNQG